MAKLTYEDKKEIIRLYYEEHYSPAMIARKFNMSIPNIALILRRYEMHGEKSLKKKKNRKYPPDIKLEIINRVFDGESKRSICIQYQIRHTMINNWIHKYEKLGYDGLINKPKGRPPSMKKPKKKIDPNDKDAVIKQKDEEILELKAEVEALKKLRALVLQRNQQQTKKKQ